jgi:hypothetical protein
VFGCYLTEKGGFLYQPRVLQHGFELLVSALRQ